jgi:hypothetical protein
LKFWYPAPRPWFFPSLFALESYLSQRELVDLDNLVSSMPPYRRFHAYLPDPTAALADVRHLKGADGDGVERLFRCLLVQFMEDLSKEEPLLPDTNSEAPYGECRTRRRFSKTFGEIVWAIVLSPEAAHRFFSTAPQG